MIIFDLDGTLVNSEKFLKEVEAELKCELGFPISLEEQIERFGGIGPYQQLEMDNNLPKEFAQIAEQRFREQAKDKLEPCARVVEFLQRSESKRVIASNGPLEWIKTALDVTGLDRFFDSKDLYHVGLVENKKPAPDLFLMAARECESSHVVVVEDSITGVTAGLASGFKTIGYLGASTTPEKLDQKMRELGVAATFGCYSQLPELLK